MAFWLTPIEFVKVRMQAQAGHSLYRNPVHCTVKVFRDEGLKVFFRGHSTTLFRESIGGAVYFGMYELACRFFTPPGGSKADLHPGYMMLSGSIGGASYWISTFPADTIKSRIQSTSNSKVNVFDVFRDIYKVGGVKGKIQRSVFLSCSIPVRINVCMITTGFYRGLSVTLCRAMPSNAIIFYTYEKTLSLIRDL